ncbi:hypothetical protein J6590_010721 [Homalodisca vitripennis]|nr:hypothetical protein J6590_010721 [Homalodisca vitripennis]
MFKEFPSSSKESFKAFHRTDTFNSLTEKDKLSNMLSKLNKMDDCFQNLNTHITSTDCRMGDISLRLSMIQSRLLAIDKELTLENVGKKSKDIKTSLDANLKVPQQNPKKDSICPSSEVAKTSTSLESYLNPSKEESPKSVESSCTKENLL